MEDSDGLQEAPKRVKFGLGTSLSIVFLILCILGIGVLVALGGLIWLFLILALIIVICVLFADA